MSVIAEIFIVSRITAKRLQPNRQAEEQTIIEFLHRRLAHAPNIFPAAVERKIDLVLAGHTHGGQMRLPFIGAVTVPGQGLFPEWDYGVFRSGRTTMIISGGLGESGIPLRFNNNPEIVLVTLVP